MLTSETNVNINTNKYDLKYTRKIFEKHSKDVTLLNVSREAIIGYCTYGTLTLVISVVISARQEFEFTVRDYLCLCLIIHS